MSTCPNDSAVIEDIRDIVNSKYPGVFDKVTKSDKIYDSSQFVGGAPPLAIHSICIGILFIAGGGSYMGLQYIPGFAFYIRKISGASSLCSSDPILYGFENLFRIAVAQPSCVAIAQTYHNNVTAAFSAMGVTTVAALFSKYAELYEYTDRLISNDPAANAAITNTDAVYSDEVYAVDVTPLNGGRKRRVSNKKKTNKRKRDNKRKTSKSKSKRNTKRKNVYKKK